MKYVITCSTPATSTNFFLLKTDKHSSAMVKCSEYFNICRINN